MMRTAGYDDLHTGYNVKATIGTIRYRNINIVDDQLINENTHHNTNAMSN